MKLVDVQRSLDRIGGNILCAFSYPFLSNKQVENPQKILVINLWGMGDAVLTISLIDEVRKKFPHAELDVLATRRVKRTYIGFLSINKILLLEEKSTYKKRKYYDLVFDTEQYLNSSALAGRWLGKEVIGYAHGQRAKLYSYTVPYNDKQHTLHTYLDLLRVKFPEVKNPDELQKLCYGKEEREAVVSLLRQNGITKSDFLIGLCVSSAESASSRRWPKEKFSQLADILIKKYGAKIILVSGPEDSEINEGVNRCMYYHALNVAPYMSVKKTFAIVEQCALFISNDTGPMHVSAAQQVPTIGLFGPNTPVRYGPYGKKNKAVYKPVCTEPCINVHLGKVPKCEEHNHMSLIEVEDVMKVVEELVENHHLLPAT